jgi:hypothetical protein
MPAGAVKATRILYACQRVGVATVPAALLLPFFPLSCPMDGGVAWSSRCRWLHCTALHWWHQLSCRAEGQSAAEPAPSPPPPPVSESLCRYPSRRVWACGGKAAAPAQPCAAPSSIIRARPGWTVVVDVRSLGCFCHSVVDATSCSALVDWATDRDVPANAWRSGRQVFKPGSRAVRSLAHPLCAHARRRPNTNSSLPLPHLSSVLLRTCSIPFHEASNKVR